MQYLRLLGPVIVGATLTGGLLAAVIAALGGAGQGRPRSVALLRVLLSFLLGAGAALTLAITLLPQGAPAPARHLSVDVAQDLRHMFIDFPSSTSVLQVLINVALLAWLGALPPLLSARVRLRHAVLMCLAGSLTIEVLQLVLLTGRAATLADVALNVLGGALAALISITLLRPRLRRWAASRAEREPEGSHQEATRAHVSAPRGRLP